MSIFNSRKIRKAFANVAVSLCSFQIVGTHYMNAWEVGHEAELDSLELEETKLGELKCYFDELLRKYNNETETIYLVYIGKADGAAYGFINKTMHFFVPGYDPLNPDHAEWDESGLHVYKSVPFVEADPNDGWIYRKRLFGNLAWTFYRQPNGLCLSTPSTLENRFYMNTDKQDESEVYSYRQAYVNRVGDGLDDCIKLITNEDGTTWGQSWSQDLAQFLNNRGE